MPVYNTVIRIVDLVEANSEDEAIDKLTERARRLLDVEVLDDEANAFLSEYQPEPWCNHDAVAVIDGVCECGVKVPEEGCTRCHCGAKYWDGLKCASCGAIWDGIDHT